MPKQKQNLKARLSAVLSEKELAVLRSSYDIFGDIAVVEIPPELRKKEKLIGKTLLKSIPSLRAVFKKSSIVYGKYRLRKLKCIAGKGSTLVVYKENNCIFKFDAQKVFFTPRMSSERMRVAKQVKVGETVLDMFAGAGPFSILIAKTQPLVARIYAVDINKDAVGFLAESASMNRISHKIISFVGDSREVIKKYLANSSDRVIMNLPKTTENYFPEAVLALRKKGILHFYTFAENEQNVRFLIKKCLKGFNFEIKLIKKVRAYSPKLWNFVADIEVKKPSRSHKKS